MKRVSVLSNDAFQYNIITFQTLVTSQGDNSNEISLSLTIDTRTLSILKISHPFIVIILDYSKPFCMESVY